MRSLTLSRPARATLGTPRAQTVWGLVWGAGCRRATTYLPKDICSGAQSCRNSIHLCSLRRKRGIRDGAGGVQGRISGVLVGGGGDTGTSNGLLRKDAPPPHACPTAHWVRQARSSWVCSSSVHRQ